ncbi:MAG: hypothetical protein VKJ24_13005 [Synechococcales bacterium]|nr:hypothetical protein [Synechococcales bacterium]
MMQKRLILDNIAIDSDGMDSDGMDSETPRQRWTVKHWGALGAILITLGLWIEMKAFSAGRSGHISQQCRTPIQARQRLSRQQFSQLITMPEGTSRKPVQARLKMPYCQLNAMTIRANTSADRHLHQLAPEASLKVTPEAYQMDGDHPLWVVVLYEGDRYLGYRFIDQ